MSADLICDWLQLPDRVWPPDHYTLLGLPKGEGDQGRIEEQVRQRMERVRAYQLTHPEPATEAMNRLAQALVCLTDPDAKRGYDAALSLGSLAKDRIAAPAKPADPFAWLLRELAGAPAETAIQGVAPLLEPACVAVFSELRPLLHTSSQQRGAKRALYEYCRRTHQLLWRWEQVGRFLKDPREGHLQPAKQAELSGHLQAIRELLGDYLPILGEPDQPGSLVLTLARQPLIEATLQTLLPSQRESLARDWAAGHSLLRAYRKTLRDELHSLSLPRSWTRRARKVRNLLLRQLDVFLLILAALALHLAYPPISEWWFIEVPLFSTLVLATLVLKKVYG